jgi:hypothetical protein
MFTEIHRVPGFINQLSRFLWSVPVPATRTRAVGGERALSPIWHLDRGEYSRRKKCIEVPTAREIRTCTVSGKIHVQRRLLIAVTTGANSKLWPASAQFLVALSDIRLHGDKILEAKPYTTSRSIGIIYGDERSMLRLSTISVLKGFLIFSINCRCLRKRNLG